MAQIIDNVKVGNFIKSLLKDKHMTQDQLAETLHITKAAVSQNLNGKSTFDIQNLLKIAELFQLTLDDLVAGRRPQDLQDIDSEYVRMIKRGLKHFQSHDPSQFHLTQPDVYGKLLIDYLLADRLNDWITYIVEKKIKVVESSYHRHQALMQHLILYVFQHKLTSPLPLIEEVVKTYGELTFATEMDLQTFLHLLEQEPNLDIATKIFTEKTIYTSKKYVLGFAFPIRLTHYWINRPLFIDMVIRQHHVKLWKMVIEQYILSLAFIAYETYFKRLVKNDFADGIVALIEAVKPLPSYEVYPSQDVIEALALLISQKRESAVQIAIQKHLLYDLHDLFFRVLTLPTNDYLQTLIAHYPKDLKAKKLIKKVIETNAFALIENNRSFFDEDVLSYGLDAIPLDHADKETLTNLIKLGATFKPIYYNRFTTEKMNRLVVKTKKGKTTHAD
jgi:transcriptional regulator with XRE-family HTH domain